MNKHFVSRRSIADFSLWNKLRERRVPASFSFELTSRCNLNCRHCYVNRPVHDQEAKDQELKFPEIKNIIDESVSLGALWCLITGGEPLVRKDFPEIYEYLKKKGVLVSIFTNATLITHQIIGLFTKHPPRDIEVTVYGVTQKTYESVTRQPGSFFAFQRGLDLLQQAGLPIRLKSMVLRSNYHELPKIAEFCRSRTKDFFRFDPFLHLRYDRDPRRNRDIQFERLAPEEIVQAEISDPKRFQSVKELCDLPGISQEDTQKKEPQPLFLCNAGLHSFSLGPFGEFRLCHTLTHPRCTYDLKTGSVTDAWYHFVPAVRQMRSGRTSFLEQCRPCPLINLCMWCPADAYLETGQLDAHVDYFCRIAHLRAAAIGWVGS